MSQQFVSDISASTKDCMYGYMAAMLPGKSVPDIARHNDWYVCCIQTSMPMFCRLRKRCNLTPIALMQCRVCCKVLVACKLIYTSAGIFAAAPVLQMQIRQSLGLYCVHTAGLQSEALAAVRSPCCCADVHGSCCARLWQKRMLDRRRQDLLCAWEKAHKVPSCILYILLGCISTWHRHPQLSFGLLYESALGLPTPECNLLKLILAPMWSILLSLLIAGVP